MSVGSKIEPVVYVIPANPELVKRVNDFLDGVSKETFETVRNDIDNYILAYENLAFIEAEKVLREHEYANSIEIKKIIDKDLLIAKNRLDKKS